MSKESKPTPDTSDRRLLWLAVALTPGLGPTRARKLVEHFGGVEQVFRASLTELEAVGLQAVSAQSLATGRSQELAREEMLRAAAAGAELLTLDDAGYPPLLRQIYDPPVVLYVRGDAGVLARAAIAVVGTRHPTPYGLGMAERLSADLAARGRTVAVFGTGVDVIYPRENRKIADSLLALGGAVISEFPIGSFAAPQNFPIRNRIISGLALGVLVVEAGEYSGTRITARCALEQNREVFAVPGNVTNKNSWGPHTLIKQGAKLVATWEDVWDEVPAEVRAELAPQPSSESSSPSTASLFGEDSLAPHEKKVLSLLKPDESTHIDDLVVNLEPEISASEIFAALFELELAGKVRQLPGKNFVKSF